MPVYEYQCLEHEHRFDLYQPVGAEAPACPVCGSATRKVYSSVGLIFKGAGFHVNDYRRPATGGDKADGKPDGTPAQDAKPTAGTPDGASSGSAAKSGSDGGEAKPSKKASDA